MLRRLRTDGIHRLKRIVLGIQYDGAAWHGWQTQPDGQTLQDKLETALKKFTCHDVATVCAGRTDAGVHALEQVVHFDTPLERPAFSWVRGVNSFLPPSIAVRWACDVTQPTEEGRLAGDSDFHARFSAASRSYHYLLYNHPIRSPLLAGKAGWIFRPLKAELMQHAAEVLIGTHDFSSFRSSECQAASPVRTMLGIEIKRHGDMIIFTLQANAFLHHMVRNIVGALIATGTGEKPRSWMEETLHRCDRTRSAPTFMPDGLYLAKVEYAAKWSLPQENTSFPWH